MYIYIYIYMYIYIYIYIYIFNLISCAQVYELPWDHWRIGNNQEGTLYLYFIYHICINNIFI